MCQSETFNENIGKQLKMCFDKPRMTFRKRPIDTFSLIFSPVWPLTQFFFLFLFCELIDLPGGQINDPSLGKHYSKSSSQQLTRLRLRPSKGFLS